MNASDAPKGTGSAMVAAAPPAADAFAHFRHTARWGWAEVAVWLVPVAAYFLLPERLSLLTEIAILGLFALSLDLILGYAGIVSLGHAAFFGVGAYTVAVMSAHGWGQPLLGLVAAAVLTTVLGFVTSFLVLRGRDLTRLMVTLGIALMLYELANEMRWLTGGADGMQGMAIEPVFGRFNFDLYGRTAYIYVMVVTFVLFFIARRLVKSPFGLSLRAAKSNRLRMIAIGAPVDRRLVAIYTIGAAYAGIAGGLLAEATQFVSLDVLGFERSAEALLVLIIGGAGTLYGAFVGAVVYKLMNVWLADITVQYWTFWLGLALVVLVLFARDGVLGFLSTIRRRVTSRNAPDDAP